MCEVHLDKSLTLSTMGTARKVAVCQPTVEHIGRHQEVLDELRRRRQAAEEEEAEARRRAAEKRTSEGRAAVEHDQPEPQS